MVGGAFVTAALSLILLALGTGLGLSSVSLGSNTGLSAATVGTAAIVWLILMQLMSASMGGYLAGRLRTKWASIHTDEVYFRDTANGFLVWAVGLVVTVSFMASAATSMVGGTAHIGAEAMTTGVDRNPGGYFVDTLLRSNHPSADRNDVPMQAEVGRIFANALRQNDIPAADRTYLAQLTAARTGLSQPEAEHRVADVISAARQAEDTARKAAAHLLLWIFIALLIGAFCASYAATLGGRQRDHMKLI